MIMSDQVRKRPRQQRSRHLVEAILQASAQIFADQGYAGATTNKIAERAGVSVGSLYQYFPNKDSLLSCLLEKHHEDVHEIVGKALKRFEEPGCALEDWFRQLLKELMALHRSDPDLTKALSIAVLHESEVAQKLHKEREEGMQLHYVASLLAARADVRYGDYLAMAAILSQTMSQMTRWLVHDAPAELGLDQLFEEAIQLFLRFIEK